MLSGNTLLDCLQSSVAKNPDKIFLQTQDSSCSFRDFQNKASAIASLIRKENGEENIVGIYESSPINFFLFLVGVWMAGARAVPLNIRMPEKNVASCIEKSRCAFVIGTQANRPAGVACRYLSVTEPSESEAVPAAAPGHDAIIMFTSGSTGEPKAIPLTFEQITENARLTAEAVGMRATDKILITMPPYFTSAICHFLTCVLTGASLFAMSGFNFGAQLLSAIDRFGITAFGGSPVNVRRILGAAKTGDELAAVRFWISSGDYLNKDEQEAFLSRFPNVRFYYMYGLSEVGGRLCVNDTKSFPHKIGSAGVPLPGMSVVAIDDGGHLLPHGQTGELKVSGPLLMAGYLGRDGIANAKGVEGGFLTGDMGYVDEDGFVWLVGRKDDVLKVGGEKVSTIHVEDSLRKRSNCRDCCVAIIEEQNLGHVLIGLVVPEQEGHAFDTRKLYESLRKDLPPNAIPAKIFEVQEIPRTGSGKVRRAEAKALALSKVRSG